MTWFSSMTLNPQKRGGRKLLGSPQAMHAAVMSAFEPGALDGLEGRPLWRIDSDQHVHRLYVVSPVRPDLTHIVEQGGWVGQKWDAAPYEPFLERLKIGQEWAFRLTANPVKRLNLGGGRGQIKPHQTVECQTQWLLERSAGWGFDVPDYPLDELHMGAVSEDSIPNLIVVGKNDRRFTRGSEPVGPRAPQVTIRQTQFEGTLRVTDADALRSALVAGMGRGKAYGCGLITLRRKG